jgi:hypothetical protein
MTNGTGGQDPSTETPDGKPRPHQLDLPFDPTPVLPGVQRDRDLDATGPSRHGPDERDAPEREGPDDRDPCLDAGPGQRDTIYVNRHITQLGVRVHGRIYSSPAVQAARMAGERRVRVAVDAADPRWIFALVHPRRTAGRGETGRGKPDVAFGRGGQRDRPCGRAPETFRLVRAVAHRLPVTVWRSRRRRPDAARRGGAPGAGGRGLGRRNGRDRTSSLGPASRRSPVAARRSRANPA